jgi:signal recognition particle subunit SRP54
VLPFYSSYEETDPTKIASDGLAVFKQEKQDLIIVDTSGRHAQSDSLFEEMRWDRRQSGSNLILFVMDADRAVSGR